MSRALAIKYGCSFPCALYGGYLCDVPLRKQPLLLLLSVLLLVLLAGTDDPVGEIWWLNTIDETDDANDDLYAVADFGAANPLVMAVG